MKHTSTVTTLVVFTLIASVSVAQAQGYTPLAPLPGTLAEGGSTTNLSSYVAGMIKLSIALGAALAVLFAIIGGTQYVAASINPSAKANALEKVWNALIGLAIILSSYLVLNSINPNLVNFKLELPPVTVRHEVPGSSTYTTDASGCPSITPVSTLLTSSEALQMENGTTLIWTASDNPSANANLKKLKAEFEDLSNKLPQLNSNIKVAATSAYRPYEYQKHLWEIYNAWIVQGLQSNTRPECSTTRATVKAEYEKHKLLGLVADPDTQTSPHTTGRGIDISLSGINYNDFSSIFNKDVDQNGAIDINDFMRYNSIDLSWQGLANDRVHFNLR